MSKIKIFVHEISHVSEGAFDRDREFYTTISSRIVVYCNREKLDFSDIRYWHVVEGLRRSIEKQSVPYDHYGYTGDFSNINGEILNNLLNNFIHTLHIFFHNTLIFFIIQLYADRYMVF